MPKKEKQKQAHMQYVKDELGHDVLLKDGSLHVMMEWEKNYMETCIDALKPKGDVLEIGFGLGYSATQIQEYHPKSHTIIECEPIVIQKAKKWAENYSNIKIVEGFWQDQLGKLGVFDTIFFDDYTPFSKEEVEKIEAEAKAFHQNQKNAEKTNVDLKAVFKQMQGIKFTDEQVVDFVKYLHARAEKASQQEVVDFIQTLVKQKNITLQQEVKFLDEYEKTNKPNKMSNKISEADVENKPLIGDRLLNFYQLSLDHHMRKGSCMSSYIDLKQFKKNYGQFEKLIASRPDVECKQRIIPVEVPSNCEYYTGNEALVLTITKI